MKSDNDVVAVDDISYSECKVVSVNPCEFLCTNQICVPYEAECDFTDDCGDGTDENTCSKHKFGLDFLID